MVLSKINPTISGSTQKSFTYGISATGYAPNTNAVTLTSLGISSDSTGTISYTEYTDTNNVGTVSGNTLTFSQVGTVTIQVNLTAGDFHNALSSLVTFNVVLNKGSQTVSFAQSSITLNGINSYNNTIQLSGYASSSTSSVNPILYSLYNTSSSVAVIRIKQTEAIALVIYGYGTITLRAQQDASTNYNASEPVDQIITVNLAQDLTFTNVVQIYDNSQVGDTYPLSGLATSSTGNPIQYALVDTPSSVAEIQTVRGIRANTEEQVLVINGPGEFLLKAIQVAGEGYSQTETEDLTNWRIIGQKISNIATDSTGQYIYRSFVQDNVPQRSTDYGANWTDLPQLSAGDNESIAISGNGLVVVVYNQYSTNGGADWNTYNWPNDYSSWEEMRMNNTGTLWYTCAKTPDFPVLLFYVSTDYGQTWTLIHSYSQNDTDLKNICMSDNGFVKMFCVRSGVYISVGGGTWTKRAPLPNLGTISTAKCTSVDCDASGSKIFLTLDNGKIYRSEDQGINWVSRGPIKKWTKVVCDSSGKIVVAADSSQVQPRGRLWTSSDEGNHWKTRSVYDANYGELTNYVKMAISRNGGKRVFAIRASSPEYLIMATQSSQGGTNRFPQYVSYVSNLTRHLALGDTESSNPEIQEIEDEVLILDESSEPIDDHSRGLTMTPGQLTIDNVIYGSIVSIEGIAVSDTQTQNPIIYKANTDCVSISGTTMTILQPGTFTLLAYQYSFEYYSASNVAEKEVTVVFSKSIWFPNKPITKNYGDAPFIPQVQTLVVGNYTFSLPPNNNVATTNGTTVTIIGGGTVTLTVTQVIGTNGDYSSNSDTVQLIVNPINQTLTFNPMTKAYRQTFVPEVSTNANPSYSSYTFSVPANNGVAVTNNNGTSLTVIGLGEVMVTVTQAANSNYNSATTTAKLTAVQANQTLTFNNIYKNEKSKSFTPIVSTNAYPSYSAYTFSVPPNNKVATVNNNIITILGMGSVQVTVNQAENELYHSATATATLWVISKLKRSQINLYDVETDTQHMLWTQTLNSTLGDFPGLVTFYETRRNILIDDVIGRLRRYKVSEISINNVSYDSSNRAQRLDAFSSTLDRHEFDILLLDAREDSIETGLKNIDLEQQAIQGETDSFESYLENIETQISQVDSRTDVIETRIQVSENRSSLLETIIVEIDSNTSRLEGRIIDSNLELVAIEQEIDTLESRYSQAELDIDVLESRQSAVDTQLNQLNSTTDSLVHRIETFDTEVNRVEHRISNTDELQNSVEHHLSSLKTEMDTNDFIIEDIKSTILAIVDGNLPTHLSTLQDITEQFNNTVNGEEDLLELQERVSFLESILLELTMENQ